MVKAAEGESVYDYREAAEKLLMSVAEINRAQLRALMGAGSARMTVAGRARPARRVDPSHGPEAGRPGDAGMTAFVGVALLCTPLP